MKAKPKMKTMRHLIAIYRAMRMKKMAVERSLLVQMTMRIGKLKKNLTNRKVLIRMNRKGKIGTNWKRKQKEVKSSGFSRLMMCSFYKTGS